MLGSTREDFPKESRLVLRPKGRMIKQLKRDQNNPPASEMDTCEGFMAGRTLLSMSDERDEASEAERGSSLVPARK